METAHDTDSQTRLILESIERNSRQTQRSIAVALGIALGLANSHIRRCVSRGLVSVQQASAHRHAYFLTAAGFAEKARLTAQHLDYSFSSFREARSAYSLLLAQSRNRRMVLAGISELAEIAVLCALESGMKFYGIVDDTTNAKRFMGLPVFMEYSLMPSNIHGAIITNLRAPSAAFTDAARHFGEDRVLAPRFLSLSRTTFRDAAE